jgi:TonB-linked SusC/RagA family outer membrane protein
MSKLYLSVKWPVVLLFVCLSGAVWAQNRTINGKVTSSDDGSALPGVNILEKGTTNGTVTDANGAYSITVGSNSALIFSFVGYLSQEVQAGTQSTIDITLQTDVATLSEIVVIGYGEVQKKDLTGAVVSVSAEKFNRGIMTAPQDLLVGKVAGVQVVSNNGAPGAGSMIRIRGGSSMNASNDPLIVIDGFPVDNNTLNGSPNALASLNPADIETFTILKDASATAIYGSRASAGVILITTKKGKSGKPTLNYNGQVSLSAPIKYVDVMSGEEIRALAASKLGTLGINQAALDRLGDSNTDWQKEIYRNAISHDHNINLSGSAGALPYRVSYGFTDQQGILKTTSMNRHSLNVRLTPVFLDDNLRVDASFKGSFTKNNFGEAGAVGAAASFDPTQPVFNGDQRFGGYFAWLDNSGDPNTIAPRNPVAMLNLTDNRSEVYRAIGNLTLDYRLPFFPALRANLNMGFDRSESEGANNVSTLASWYDNEGRLTDYTAQQSSKLFDFYLNYTKELDKHKVDVMAGYSYQAFKRDGSNLTTNADRSEFFDYDLVEGDGPEPDTIPRQFIPNPNYLISFFGRLNYSYKEKLLLTATFRTDGSSRFAEDNRWGMFPALALAWKLKEEAFMDGAPIVSDLKLRAGYGVTGQQDIGPTYPYLPTYQESTPTAQYQFGNQYYNTLRPAAYDAKIKWEEATTYNVGVDFGFADNRLTGSIDYYFRETKDLINRIPIAAGSNFSNYLTTNVGDTEGKGIELTLNGQVIKSADLNWNVGFNFAYNQVKITKLLKTDDPNYPGDLVGDISGGVGSRIQVHKPGYAPFSFFPFEQVYDESGMPIEGLYVDRSGKGGSVSSDNLNRYPHHSPAPKFLMGLNTQLSYKNFDFSFSGRLSLGNYVYNNGASGTQYQGLYVSAGNFFNNMRTSIYDTEFTTTQYYSSHYVEDASFFKMDNINLGYNFEKIAGDRLKARLSFTVQNAFTITQYDGLDPELGNGIDNNLYPRPRVFLLGISLTY